MTMMMVDNDIKVETTKLTNDAEDVVVEAAELTTNDNDVEAEVAELTIFWKRL